MQHETHASHDSKAHGSLKSYTIGFVFSILLTIIPIAVVMNGWLAGKASSIVLMITAVLQLAVQLIFFMHLREEDKPRYNLLSLILGLIILLVIVVGSMWIMMYNMVAI
ncbi:cytochrome o ubiquinol oxidase subunit IV [Paenibacillus guangzhouensis]|uniref:cytochrome o ubiquinol oxidase subunit IV n=1 Tax=Paenibacillus guangzhouensis TaxID=1473112 RepID=UPI001266D5A1|nr:cytochrome o ubiquinol oxidase subunit IV [Paenibacillus guangzhouensis]